MTGGAIGGENLLAAMDVIRRRRQWILLLGSAHGQPPLDGGHHRGFGSSRRADAACAQKGECNAGEDESCHPYHPHLPNLGRCGVPTRRHNYSTMIFMFMAAWFTPQK